MRPAGVFHSPYACTAAKRANEAGSCLRHRLDHREELLEAIVTFVA